jgi:aspartokinase/homoserine dehydrogenase 1
VEILKSNWTENGVPVTVLKPEDIQLAATPDFGNATFISVNSGKISDLEDGIYLIPGSYGITAAGKIARAGYTSADYTAAFLTRALNAQKLELWDLDKDFHRADTSIVNHPPVIKRLTYSEASELAYFEHYSFHPRTVEPLEHEHIPIQVISSASFDGIVKTTINTETYIESQIIKSVACTDDISLLKLNGPGVGLKPGILARVTTELNDSGINIKSVITSQTSINFILNKENGDKALHLIQKLGFSSVKEISVVKDLSLIGIVGHGIQQNYGVSAKIFTAVANNKINVVLSGSAASDLVSYLVVHKGDKRKSVQEIYKAFF